MLRGKGGGSTTYIIVIVTVLATTDPAPLIATFATRHVIALVVTIIKRVR